MKPEIIDCALTYERESASEGKGKTKMYILQYQSVDGHWYDQTGLIIDDLEAAKALFDSLAFTRGAEWLVRHRIVRRVDTVVYQQGHDPASEFGG